MLWFALGLVIGNLFGILLMAIFTAKKRSDWMYDHIDEVYSENLIKNISQSG